MIRIYNLRDFVFADIQLPYWPMHPDCPGDYALPPRPLAWTPDEALRQLRECPSSEWREHVLKRLRRIDYAVPAYVQHPLVDYLINEKALKQEADHD